ncbi:MAG: hypothetical protein DWC09_05900 [Candidatus Poseidoniales archaeon]|nr:MAG: hypothetical protein DWC09_05900 [Candidatus Poseidoniales archaeon]
MSGDLEVRKGERIPRRPLPDYNEASSFREAIQRDGIIGTLLGDSNQYGPLSMLFVLLGVATVTGVLIKLISTFL